MGQYISILRGINVSGKNKISMKDLKALYEEMNFKDVITYIQSGNVIFSSSIKTPMSLAERIQGRIKEHFGFDVPVIIRTPGEMDAAIKTNPFIKEKSIEIDKLHITFLENAPVAEHLEKIASYKYDPDRFMILGKEVYLYCPGGYGNTKLTNTFFESKLKVKATTRNWRTVNKLVKMANGS